MFASVCIFLLSLPLFIPYYIFAYSAAANLIQGRLQGGLVECAMVAIYITAGIYFPMWVITQSAGTSFLYYCPIVATILIGGTFINKEKVKTRSEIVYK